ncbi:MAG: hypothetical protein N3F63_04495 [Thermoplasmata archaeon]|nr:hypothetical protein [Thermoplasmata archaeon]
MRWMDATTIYQEKIFSKGLTGMLAIFTSVIILVWVYLVSRGILGLQSHLSWFFLILTLILVALTVNFSHLKIMLTPASITVCFGLFKHRVFWKDVENCYMDREQTFIYGGWGLRIVKVEGKWRLAYNVIEGARVVLSLRRGKFREFVFSTRKPEEVMFIVRQQIRGAKP